MECTISQDKTLLSLFVVFVLSLSLASAFEVQDVRLTFDREDVVYVAPGSPRMVDMSFTITDFGTMDTFTIDYTALNPGAEPSDYRRTINIASESSRCVLGANEAICRIIGILMDTDLAQPSISFTGTGPDGTTDSRSHAFSFIIDDTSPALTFIGPETCYNGECFVTDRYTRIYLDFEDPAASFSRKRVAFNYGNSPTVSVHSCSGLTCWGLAKTDCNEGQSVTASISPGEWGDSSDDAGNPVVGELRYVFTCDATPPRIDESSFDIATSSGRDTTHPEMQGITFVTIGDTVTLTFNVTEKTSPKLDVSLVAPDINIESPIVGSCDREDESDVWSCSVTFSPTPQEAVDQGLLTVRVRDVANQSSTGTFKLSVFGVVDGAQDLWSINAPALQQANKHYLEYAPKQVFIPLTLNRKYNDVRLLEVTPRSCKATVLSERQGTQRGTDADLRFEVVSFEGSTVLLRGDLNMGPHYTDLSFAEYECGLDVLSLRGDSFISSPENDTFTVKFTLYESNTIGEQVREEIVDLKNGTLDNLRWLNYVQKGLDGLQLACRVAPTLKGAGSSLNLLGVVLGSNAYTKAASEAPNKAGAGLQNTVEQGNKVLNQVCNALRCESKLMGDVFGDTGFGGAIEDMGFSTSQVLNPYDSWLSSVLMLCLPAMSQHMNNYMAIECDYIACLSKDIPTGMATIDMCQQRKSYATCDMVAGGLYNAIPFYSLAKDIVTETVNVFRDPVSLVGAAGTIVPCLLASALDGPGLDTLATKICYSVKGVTGLAEAVQSIVQIANQIQSMFNLGNFGQQSCDQVFNRMERQTTYWDYGYDASNEDVDANALYRIYDKDFKEVPIGEDMQARLAAGDDNALDYYLDQEYYVATPFDGVTSKVGDDYFTRYPGTQITYVNGRKVGPDNFFEVTQEHLDSWTTGMYDYADSAESGMVSLMNGYHRDIYDYYNGYKGGEGAAAAVASGYQLFYGGLEESYNAYMAEHGAGNRVDMSIQTGYFDPEGNRVDQHFDFSYVNDNVIYPEKFSDLDANTRNMFVDDYINSRMGASYDDEGNLKGFDGVAQDEFFNTVRTNIREIDQDTDIFEQDIFLGNTADAFEANYYVRDQSLEMAHQLEGGELISKGSYVLSLDSKADPNSAETLKEIFPKDAQGNYVLDEANVYTPEEMAKLNEGVSKYNKEVMEPQLKGGGSRSEFSRLLAEYEEVRRENEKTILALEADRTAIAGFITAIDGYDDAVKYVESGYVKDVNNLADDIQRLATNDRAREYMKELCPDCFVKDAQGNDVVVSGVETAARAAAEKIVKGDASFTVPSAADAPNSVRKLADGLDKAQSTYASSERTQSSVDSMISEVEMRDPGYDVVSQKLINDLNLNGKEQHYKDCVATGDLDQCAGAKASYDAAQAEYDRKMSSMTHTVTVLNPELQKRLDNMLANKYISPSDYDAIMKMDDLGDDASRKRLLDALEDGDKKMEDRAQELKDEIAEQQQRVFMQKYIDDNWKGSAIVGSVYASFSTVNAMTNAMANQDLLKVGWSKDDPSGFDEGMEALYNAVDHGLETATCRALGAYGEGSGSLKLTVSGDDSLFNSAAFVAGLQVVENKTGSTWYYSYLLNVYVTNQRDVEQNLTFQVVLKGPSGTKTIPLEEDEDGNLIKEYSLEYKEDTKKWTGNQFLHYPFNEEKPTTDEYDTVCIRFTNSNWEHWFDVERIRQPEFCRRLEQG